MKQAMFLTLAGCLALGLLSCEPDVSDAHLGFTRFGGHYSKGGYDVQDEKHKGWKTCTSTVLGRVQSRCGSTGFG